MQKLFILTLLLVFSQSQTEFEDFLDQQNGEEIDLFKQFAHKYHKLFLSARDTYKSLMKFEQNLDVIQEIQQIDHNSHYGITQFSDLSAEEFEQTYLNLRLDKDMKNLSKDTEKRNLGIFEYIFGVDINHLPKNFDWREKGIINKPKEQGICGSCWSFVTASLLEAQYAKKYGKLVNFSEQFLLDCDDIDEGCNGGLMTNAYKWLQTHEIQTVEQYGMYMDRQDKCHAEEGVGVTKVTKFYQIYKDENSIMKELYQNGPIAVGINGKYLQLYENGIHNPGKNCDDKVNHAVLIVGYGETEEGVKYWTLKNQWGEYWGEKGYYRMIRGVDMCGITRYATIAFIE